MMWLWAALGIVLIIVEIFVGTMVFLALAVAALLTGAAVWLGVDNVWFQLLISAVLAVISMFTVTWGLQKSNRKSEGFAIEAVCIKGERGTVLREIRPMSNGVVKLATGAEWSARSQETLPAGAEVTVTGLDGTIAVVAGKHATEE